MSKRYIGVDPGLVTGIAVYEPGVWFESKELTRGQVMIYLRHIVREGDVVLIERFIVTMQTIRKTRQNDAQQIIGAVQELCRQRKAFCLVESPAPAKRIAPDSLLKKLNWHKITKDNHANDAASLVVLALLKTNRAVYADLIGL